MHVVLGEPVAPLEEVELDHECDADDLAAQLADEVGHRSDRAARREDVVVDEHPSAFRERVRVQL